LHAGSKELTAAVRYLNAHQLRPEVGIVLGTGLGDGFVRHIRHPLVIPYNSIPFFPVSTVSGHKGQFVFGEMGGKKIMAMQGRIHYYEGYAMQKVAFPIRVMHSLGVHTLLLSNAAGNLNPAWKHGEFMLIHDHIDVMPDNPLRGLSIVEKGNIYLTQRTLYDTAMNEIIKSIAKKKRIRLHEGVYVANPGPALETQAEYRYLRFMGGDAVGMSTVPEVLMANYLGMKCAAISVLTNDAPDGSKPGKPLSLSDVIEVASGATGKLTELFTGLIKKV
jgi:purine-nucleoside phosphorylase